MKITKTNANKILLKDMTLNFAGFAAYLLRIENILYSIFIVWALIVKTKLGDSVFGFISDVFTFTRDSFHQTRDGKDISGYIFLAICVFFLVAKLLTDFLSKIVVNKIPRKYLIISTITFWFIGSAVFSFKIHDLKIPAFLFIISVVCLGIYNYLIQAGEEVSRV